MMYEIAKGVIAAGTGVLAGTGANVVMKGVVETVVKPENLSQIEKVAVEAIKVLTGSMAAGAIATKVCDDMDTIKDGAVELKKLKKQKKLIKDLTWLERETEALEEMKKLKEAREADESAEA